LAIFDGAECTKADNERLLTELDRVISIMKDGKWRTIPEFSKAANVPENSASAALRSLRKKRFGGHTVNRRIRVGTKHLFEYQLILNSDW
jgi:hypothetical protein